ncbi:MAG: thioredoxin domain-containing protein [Actinomycetota bacterium]
MPAESPISTNRLADETSPYLLQHAHNPVDWYPWGEEALARARSEDRPILLSVGYAACHWCHVMERESFENEATARVMNERFVCVKVDREERPDIDSIYMDALLAMTGRGGWPMTMFLTPDAKPYFGGTYFPPTEQHGMPSFARILDAVWEAWQHRRAEIGEQTEALVEQIRSQAGAPSSEPLTSSLISQAIGRLETSFDPVNGGFGSAPKFPQAPVLELCLRAAAGQLGRSRQMAEVTLRKMALGGIYDHLAGGFARYTVDNRWLVPHFEKMLYDNAQLSRVYTRAWQLTGDPLFKRVSIETLDYLLSDMVSGVAPGTGPPDAPFAFAASEDADSEGKEGKFYVWDYDEFIGVAPDGAQFYGVTKAGNFEGVNILTATGDDPPLGDRANLLEQRRSRVRPGRDDKALVSWNGLAVSALAEAGAAFGRKDLTEMAARVCRFLLDNSVDETGRLMHSYKDGRAGVLGMLEDYSYLTEGLLALWEVTFDPQWLSECRRLAEEMISLFWDEERGGFFSTGRDHEALIVRPKELIDGATPSSNGVASLLLLRLAVLTGDDAFAKKGVATLRAGHVYMSQAPQVAGTLLSALDFYLSKPQEIVVLGTGPGADLLKTEIWRRFLPNKVVAGAELADPSTDSPADSPLLAGKTLVAGRATAFVCENYACQAPTTDPAQLAEQLSDAAIP